MGTCETVEVEFEKVTLRFGDLFTYLAYQERWKVQKWLLLLVGPGFAVCAVLFLLVTGGGTMQLLVSVTIAAWLIMSLWPLQIACAAYRAHYSLKRMDGLTYGVAPADDGLHLSGRGITSTMQWSCFRRARKWRNRVFIWHDTDVVILPLREIGDPVAIHKVLCHHLGNRAKFRIEEDPRHADGVGR